MGLFQKNEAGIMDVIRCDEPSYLVWKWHPAGNKSGRENAIRWGSSLRVKEGEAAVFVYDNKSGSTMDYIVGPFDEIIRTANLPALASIFGLAYAGKSPFQAEVYFINLARIIQVRFAVPFFTVFDPRYKDFGVPVAVRGTVSFSITDYQDFVRLNRLRNFSLDDFQKQIRDTVCRYVKDTVANAPAAHDIPVIQIETKIAEINDIAEYDISERLKENFGVSVSGVDIGAIEIDKSSNEYAELMAVTQNVTAATVQAQTEANIRNIHDQQRINMENYRETLRIRREEGQYAQHKQTQSSNMDAFRFETQAEVGIAGAEALGQMGANGAGDVDISGGGMGFNPAAMMAGMALGGAVGQNVAGMMNNMMGGINRQQMQTPPPVPGAAAYYVAVDGQATGPFETEALKQMIMNRQLTGETLVWKQGMTEWCKAGTVEDFAVLFGEVPPVPDIR